LLRALKREFGFYCIEMCAEQPIALDRPSEVALVIGGYGSGGELLTSMERYDAMAAMNIARPSFGACMVAGDLYVIGGWSDDGSSFLTSVEKYSPASNTWSAVSPLPAGRVDHAAVAMGSALYVLGCETGDGVTANVLKLDSVHGSWSEVAPLPAPREEFASSACRNNICDTKANAWTTLAPMTFVCTYHSASLLDGQVYIVGAGNSEREVLRFNPVTNAWSTLAQTINTRDSGNSFVLAGYLYAAGGGDTCASVERYNMATNTWTPVFCIEAEGLAEEQDLFDSLITKALTQRTRADGKKDP
jgi:hypothetical protein